MITAVSHLTRLNINEVYRMPYQDFLVYLEFLNARNYKKEIEQKKEMARQRAKMKSRR